MKISELIKNKKVLLMIAGPIILVLYFVMNPPKSENTSNDVKKNEADLYDVPTISSSNVSKSKEEILADYKKRIERKRTKVENEQVSDGGFYEIDKVDRVKNEESNKNEKYDIMEERKKNREELIRSAQNTQENQTNKDVVERNKTVSKKKVKSSSSSSGSSSEKQVVKTEEESYNRGISIYSKEDNNSKNTEKSKDIIDENVIYFEAFMNESRNIKTNSQVTFVINKDIVVNGIHIEKMSRFIGLAANGQNGIDILINTINTTTGKKYNVKLVGYNENFQRGIYVEGKVDKALTKGKNTGIKSIGNVVSKNVPGGAIASGAVGDAVDITGEAMEKDLEVFVDEGYKMYFRYE